MRETRNLEFKSELSKGFLKTVSAFANYGTGEIHFGVLDDGTVIGLENPRAACLKIENQINDSLQPVPQYSLQIDDETGVVILTVLEGKDKPYFYQSKAYRRNDSASVEVDRTELKRLILQGSNQYFDSVSANKQDLTFSYLESKLKDKLGIKELTEDLLITLKLYDIEEGYTVAGELFSDQNARNGLDMVRFGDNINIILNRKQLVHMSVLQQYDQALDFFRQYYHFEVIEGAYRKKVEKIPEEAFREVIANALVHRVWDINANIQVAMYDDKLIVTSPGGLPEGISKEAYLHGNLSILRNPTVANIFFRLDLIESFGSGISRIMAAYEQSATKPQFRFFGSSIEVTLPCLVSGNNLSEEQEKVYAALQYRELSSSEIMQRTSFNKNKTLKILNELIDKGYVEKTGRGRGTRYRR